VNGRRGGQDSLLHTAAKSGEASVVSLLIEHGADVNCTNDSGEVVHLSDLSYLSYLSINLLIVYLTD